MPEIKEDCAPGTCNSNSAPATGGTATAGAIQDIFVSQAASAVWTRAAANLWTSKCAPANSQTADSRRDRCTPVVPLEPSRTRRRNTSSDSAVPTWELTRCVKPDNKSSCKEVGNICGKDFRRVLRGGCYEAVQQQGGPPVTPKCLLCATLDATITLVKFWTRRVHSHPRSLRVR